MEDRSEKGRFLLALIIGLIIVGIDFTAWIYSFLTELGLAGTLLAASWPRESWALIQKVRGSSQEESKSSDWRFRLTLAICTTVVIFDSTSRIISIGVEAVLITILLAVLWPGGPGNLLRIFFGGSKEVTKAPKSEITGDY